MSSSSQLPFIPDEELDVYLRDIEDKPTLHGCAVCHDTFRMSELARQHVLTHILPGMPVDVRVCQMADVTAYAPLEGSCKVEDIVPRVFPMQQAPSISIQELYDDCMGHTPPFVDYPPVEEPPPRKRRKVAGKTIPKPSKPSKTSKYAHESGPVKPCSDCGKKFARHDRLAAHKASWHGAKKPVECEVKGCDRTFTRIDGMKKHVRDFHRKGPRPILPKPVEPTPV